MPGMNIAEMFAQNQGNGFSGSYNHQPSLKPMQANPLAQGVQQGNPKGSATLGGIDAAMAKRGSQDNGAQRLSSAGESSGVKFKHDDAGHATGASAFDTLDGYMKKAGLNSFQTQFFGRMIESGMPEVMIEAAVKTAGDRFGAEVHAELQDGHEKLASIGSAILGGLGRMGLGGLKQTAKNTIKNTVKKTTTPAMQRTGRNVASGVRNTTKKIIGNKSRAAINPSKGQFGHGINVPSVKATGLRRGIQGVGNYIGAPALSQVGNKGFRQAGKDYLGGVMNRSTLGQRALTGGIFGATDTDPDSSFLGNVARGVGYGLIGGKGGNRMMRRGVAGSGMGFVTDRTGLTENADQTLRYTGMMMPNRLSAVPGFKNLAARVGTGEAKMLPALAKKLGLQQAGNAKTNQEFVKAFGNTPLSTGMNQSFKNNLGLLDAFDPINLSLRGAGAAVRGGKRMLANTNPALAAAGTTAAVGIPTAMHGVSKMNEMGNLGQQTADNANQVLLNANNQINELVQSTDQQVREAVKPENLAQIGKDMMQDPEVQSQINDLTSSAFGSFMQNAGTGVLGAVENFLGEGAAGFLQEHWPLLLAGAAGLGGGALMGGGTGALLGGVAMPLAMMMAQESGMFGGGEEQQQQEGSQYQSPVAVPGSAAVEGSEGMRSELEANSGQQDYTRYPQLVPPAGPAYSDRTNVQGIPAIGRNHPLNVQVGTNPPMSPGQQQNPPQGYQNGQGPLMSYQNQG